MNLESLANELLLDLFEFLNNAHLLHAFYNLNLRFNNLLFDHFRASGHLDFRSFSKHDFDIVFQQYVPFIADRLTALCLSADDETPQQIDYFLTRGLTLRSFTHLKSLSLCRLFFDQRMEEMMLEWNCLPQLTHLSIVQCQFFNESTNIRYILNSIWSLRKLFSCHLDINCIYGRFSFEPTVISPSLQRVSIRGLYCRLTELNSIFDHTPRLRYLNLCIKEYSNYERLTSHIPHITRLTLAFQGSTCLLINLLQNMPDLCHLIIDTVNIYLSGQRWKEMISNHLSKLQVFRFRMQFNPDIIIDTEHQDDLWFETYRTPFWVDEHQWFVQYHLYSQQNKCRICIYTLPYAFVDFGLCTNNTFVLSQSTYSAHCDDRLYNRVHQLSYNSSLFTDLDMSLIRFLNVKYLSIELPFSDQFWFVVPRLIELRSLDILLSADPIHAQDTQFQLQMLLDRAPHLYALAFISSTNLQASLLQNRSVSVRRLDFQRCNHYFNDIECNALIQSSLGIHCEVLLIKIDHHRSILHLVKNMTNLRALNAQCRDDKYKHDLLFIAWLKRYILCINVIKRGKPSINNIQLWLR